jgi:hypothetical protein
MRDIFGIGTAPHPHDNILSPVNVGDATHTSFCLTYGLRTAVRNCPIYRLPLTFPSLSGHSTSMERREYGVILTIVYLVVEDNGIRQANSRIVGRVRVWGRSPCKLRHA